MRKFLIRLLIFATPLLISIIVPCIVLYNTGENLNPIDRVLKSKDKYLIGYAFNESNYRYVQWKSLLLQEQYCPVVVLGSSRVLQFRHQMFDVPSFNAGYTIQGTGDFVPFLQSLPDTQLPEYLVVSLDQWMFNIHWDDLSEIPGPDHWAQQFHVKPGVTTLKNVWKGLVTRRYGFFPSTRDSLNRIGLNAVFQNTGFRRDGSRQYGEQIKNLLSGSKKAGDYQFSDTYQRIKEGDRRFEYGDTTNLAAIAKVEEFLAFCKSKNIHVIAFLPPFADAVYERMRSTHRYGYLDGIYERLQPLFAHYGFECYDFSTVSRVGSSDQEMIDGFHGGELTYTRLLVKMLEADSKLNKVTDVARLRQDMEHAINRYVVYSY
jgi:hypothetical protein